MTIKMERKLKKGRTVFVSGNFNILHPGHLRLLHFAASCGDYLLLGLFQNSDATFVDLTLRKEALLSLDMIDEIVQISEGKLATFLKKSRPDIVVKGKEHEEKFNVEREVVDSYGGKLIFGSGELQFSSKDLLNRELLEPPLLQLRNPKSFQKKHDISPRRIIEGLERFSHSKVAVFGDVILDEYIYCNPIGMSQEDPTIAVTPVDSKKFLGGAGIVAAHIAGLGAESHFFSVAGKDEDAELLKKFLREYHVNGAIASDHSRPTNKKQRFRADGKTLLRVNHLRSHDIGKSYVRAIISAFEQISSTINLVIFSDFNYGCLPQGLVDKITEICVKKKIPFFADSQSSSQTGDVSRFKQATLISATEREARLGLNDFKSGLQNISNKLLEVTRAKNLVIKLGAEGLVALKSSPKYITDSLHALNQNPVDTAGAGDAFLATSGLNFILEQNFWESVFLGSVASAIQISRSGNKPITRNELQKHLLSLE